MLKTIFQRLVQSTFYNIIQYNRQQEEGYTGRKVSVKSTGKYGKVGRPQKRRKTKKDSQVNLFQIEQKVAKKRKTPFQIEEHIRETLGTLLEEEEDANIVLVEENVEKQIKRLFCYSLSKRITNNFFNILDMNIYSTRI